jgi:hypothetical protein
MGKPETNRLINIVIFKERHFHMEPNPTLDPTPIPTPDLSLILDLETKVNF